MTRTDWLILVNFALDFAITGGSTLGGGLFGGAITRDVVIIALIMGVVAAARRAQAALSGKPPEDLQRTVEQLVAQMRNLQTATAQTTPDTAPPPPAKPMKDSS